MNDNERLRYLLTYEVALQCRQALTAIHLAPAVHRDFPLYPAHGAVEDQNEWRRQRRILDEHVLMYVHALLTHAANISKILWPPRPKNRRGAPHPYTNEQREERAMVMRGDLGVPDDSALRLREVRDDLEHLDERIERWFQGRPGPHLDLRDLDTLPFGLSSLDAGVTAIREFDMGKIRIFDGTYQLNPLIFAVEALRPTTEQWLVDHEHWLHASVLLSPTSLPQR